MLLNVCIISIYATYSACLQNDYSLHTKVISLCHYFTMHFRYICLTNNGKLKNLAGYFTFFLHDTVILVHLAISLVMNGDSD